MTRDDLLKRYTAILKTVQKPGRYIGGEVNSIVKDWDAVPLKVALVFPDSYEIAMSYMGQAILYDILNRHPLVLAERVYAPWPDMEARLQEAGLPLLSLESQRPLAEFDIVAMSVPYELTYTNILTVLERSDIPFYSRDRDERHPWVISGGTASYNPEPYAEFMDAIVIGDGEEVILQLVEDALRWKSAPATFVPPVLSQEVSAAEAQVFSGETYRFLNALRRHRGVYVPAFFRPEYLENGRLSRVVPLIDGYIGVEKAIVADLDRAAYPTQMLLPNVAPVHDRIGIEVQRGCTRACRFCQAGYIERPTRQSSPGRVSEIASLAAAATGKEEMSLLSLSVGDYGCVSPLLTHLNEKFNDTKMSISIPAARTETLTLDMIRAIKKVRQTGFTIAPEAGTERMRRVINKGNHESDLFNTVENVFKEGWRLIKFYYLMGLPTETDGDLSGIVREAQMARDIGRTYTGKPEINVSVSSFIPKPFTPFQWHGQDTLAENSRKLSFFRDEFRHRPGLNFKSHDAGMSLIEGIFSRGDRRLSALLLAAYRLGCRMDEWQEHFSFAKWQEAIANTGVDLDFYVYRTRDFDEVLPWDHLFTQMKKEFLLREYQGALEEAFVADCSHNRCEDCGICDFRTIKNRIYLPSSETVVFKKGNRLGMGSSLGLEGTGDVLPPGSTDIVPETEVAQAWQADQKRIVELPPQAAVRIRLRYAKVGAAAFIGHLDLANHLRRAIRRNDTPVLYSQGFHPQMRLAFGNPIKLGQESEAEYVDLYLVAPLDIESWIAEMNPKLPAGLRLLEGEEIPLKAPSIQVMQEEQKRNFKKSQTVPSSSASAPSVAVAVSVG